MATRSEMAGDDESADAQLMARICWHYFREGLTQEAIAQRLGLTRKKVNRTLNDARTNGFVQITINSPIGPCVELEGQLTRAFGLRRAVVIPAPGAETDVRTVVGAAAGQYISDNLQDGASLGITWGGTVNSAAQNVIRRVGRDNKIVLLCGGLAKSTSINPYDNAALFARALDATCFYLTAPMLTESAELRDAFMNSEPIRAVLHMASQVDMALLSAIDLSEQSKALEYEVISRKTWKSLRSAGAVGEVCGHYLDAAGSKVSHPINDCTIHPALEVIQKIPELILAAGGLHKVSIILGAIRAKLCHVLITDEETATALLAQQ